MPSEKKNVIKKVVSHRVDALFNTVWKCYNFNTPKAKANYQAEIRD